MQPIFNTIPKSVLYLFWAIVVIHIIQAILPVALTSPVVAKMVFVPLRYYSFENIFFDPLASIISPFAYSFLHADFTHLFMNMALFLPFGLVIAHAIGNVGFGMLYHLGAFGGALFAYILEPTSVIPMVGASASVSALVGFIISSSFLGLRFPSPFNSTKNTMVFFIMWFVLNVVYPYLFAHSISWEAHMGGFVVGFASGIVCIPSLRLK